MQNPPARQRPRPEARPERARGEDDEVLLLHRGLTVAHTAQLDPAVLREVRSLLVGAFDGRFDVEDWRHALGGMHALVHEAGSLIAHGAVVQRLLLHRGRTLRVGYVEAVAVDVAHRRRGHASAVMDALEEVIRRAYDAGALGASDAGARLYASRGWTRWQGPTSALTPSGLVRTPEEDGTIWVLDAGAQLEPGAELTCDWRDGDLW